MDAYELTWRNRKTFDLEELAQQIASAPEEGSRSVDAALHEFVAMTYDPPPAALEIPPYTSDVAAACFLYSSEAREIPGSPMQICLDAIRRRINEGGRFVDGSA